MKKDLSESITGSAMQVINEQETNHLDGLLPDRSSGLAGLDRSMSPAARKDQQQIFKVGSAPTFTTKTIFATATVIILMVVGIVAIYLYNNKPWQTHAALKAAPPAVTVTVAPAVKRMVDDDVIVTGSVSAWDPLSVGSEVGGLRITTVNIEEGDKVKRGQVLATLNSALLKTQLEQAKARLASNQATLKKSIQPNRTEDIRGLEAALAQAEANTAQEIAHAAESKSNLADANLNAQRYQNLAKMGANSAQEAEAKQLAAATARQEFLSANAKVKATRFMEDQAREHMLAAQRGGRNEDVDISKAALAETKAQINQLVEQIAETIIVSPDDGLISKRDAHIGDITTAGTPLFSIIRLNRLELRAQVSDLDLIKFKPGQIVTVSATEEDAKPIKGIVKLVSPQVDPLTRLGTVRVSLPTNAGLKPGMFARADVNFGRRSAITVPVGAVISRNGESFVFTIDGDRVSSCPVKVGSQTDTYAEILSGLEANQKVVVQGARFLSDRDIVRVAE
jgi:HlyD family secretion protein